MMNFIQRFFSKERSDQRAIRQSFSHYFFTQPEHSWLLSTTAEENFKKLFELLPVGVLKALMTKYPIAFVPRALLKEHGAGMSLMNTVVIFPEFQKLICTNKTSAVAYLAHELALVLYELEERQDANPLMAEVEADKFVCDLGLSLELEELLLMMDETIEKRLRLTYLTIHHFTGGEN